MKIAAKRFLTDNGWQNDMVVEVINGVITSLKKGKDADIYTDIVTPGLFDTHIHGGNRFDSAHCTVENMEKWLLDLRTQGVSAVLVTLSAQPLSTMRRSMEIVRKVMDRQQDSAGARVLGIHLEGPFISPQKPGAMNFKAIQIPSAEHLRNLIEGYEDIIKIMTLAPELPGSEEVVQILLEYGIKVQIGHSAASFEEGQAAFSSGIKSVCHFFNAAPGIHHRDPGFLTAALLQPDVYCEAICDLVHVHWGALKFLYQAKGPDRMVIISDAVPATNLPDGEYDLENNCIIVKAGTCRLSDGTLNGGGTYLPGAVRNLVSIGIPSEDAFTMASRTAASGVGVQLPTSDAGQTAFLAGWTDKFIPEWTILGDSFQRCDIT